MTEQQRPRGEVDHCRYRLLKFCKGQGVDLGCGASMIKVDAIGVDLYHPNADLKMDARILKDFPDNHFNYVFSSHLLEEISNTEATLREWLRILKPGGNIVLYQADKKVYYQFGDPRCNSGHIHHFNKEDLWSIFEKIGNVKLIHSHDPIGSEWSFELVVQKIDPEITVDLTLVNEPDTKTAFKFLIVGGPVENYIERCLQSIADQNYPNWTAQVVLDPLGDESYNNALKFQSDKIKVVLNDTRQYNIANFLKASDLIKPDDEDVLIMLDADDWLAGPDSLSIVKSYYDSNPDLLVTHGSWAPYPRPNFTNNIPYSEQDFINGVRKTMWRASHLKTFKAKLWKFINKEDLKDSSGQYYKVSGDLALMYPMLEMAGYQRVRFIPEIVHIYNQDTPFNDDKINHDKQIQVGLEIQNKTPYPYRTSFKEEIKEEVIVKSSSILLNTVIYSKDRACQLDAFLRSMKHFWKTWKEDSLVSVLWDCQNEDFLAGYNMLMKDHPDIHFVNQKAKGFKSTVVDLMKNDIPYNVQFVDDIVFINPFTLLCPEFEAFKTDPETTCLSLRMHPGISYCYMLDQQTPPPENISSGKWAWTGLQGDWKYPYSTDGHIFRNEDILPCILNENYQHPNGLEDKMTGAVVQRPYVRCFPKAKLINIPSNRVGQNVSNRHGDISAELLNSNYLKGMKIDIRPFFGVDKNAVHCEMEYTWIQP